MPWSCVPGGRGRCRFLLPPLGSSLPSRPSRCVLRVVPPGCPFPSPAGAPFYAVCAFRGLGPVCPSGPRGVSPACVCPRAPAAYAPPPPSGSSWRAHHEGARGRGRLSPGCGAPGVGPSPTPMGTRHQPHSARSGELAFRAVGEARGRPGVGVSCLRVGVRGWALSPARPPVLGACGPGPLPTCCWCGGGVGVGTRNQPHIALLRADCARFGTCTREPGGGTACLRVGRPGLGALPRLTARPWGVRPGPTTHPSWVRGVRAWGPVTNSTTCALVSWLCALWGERRVPRGRAPLVLVWGVRGRALTHARLSVLGACGRGPLPTGCGCGGCGRGDLVPTPQGAH